MEVLCGISLELGCVAVLGGDTFDITVCFVVRNMMYGYFTLHVSRTGAWSSASWSTASSTC